jgi:hypothetical protein
MTRQRIVLGAWLAVTCAGALPACGGSSSETPPPLEPDPRGFHYAPALPASADSDAGDTPAPSTPSDDDDKPRAKANSTWGGVKPAAH